MPDSWDGLPPRGSDVISLRLAVPSDAQALRLLRLEALQDNPAAFSADYELTRAQTVSEWEERIASQLETATGAICAATTGGNLVGMCGIATGHWPKTSHSATIWGAYVKPQWRGAGIGRRMIDECLRWAKAHGATVAKLGVITSNEPAIRCYRRCGFTEYGIEPRAINFDGKTHDELLMGRTL